MTSYRPAVPGDWIQTEGKRAVALECPQIPVLYEDGTFEWRPLHCVCRIDEEPAITVAQIVAAREKLRPSLAPVAPQSSNATPGATVTGEASISSEALRPWELLADVTRDFSLRELQEKTRRFMRTEFGPSASLDDPDRKTEWYVRLGLLAHFVEQLWEQP